MTRWSGARCLQTNDNFDEAECEAFIAAKERLWDEYDYGPWAFVVNGRFASWGGLQSEEGDVDLVVVLHPDYWSLGKAIYDRLSAFAFEEKGFESVTILLPPSRKRCHSQRLVGLSSGVKSSQLPDGRNEDSFPGVIQTKLAGSGVVGESNRR